MTELISRLEIKKVHQIIQRVDIFCSALLLQAWRRIYYIFNKQEVRVSIKERAGNCLRCGRCCQASIRCKIYATMKKGFHCVRYMIKDRSYVPCIRTIKTISFSTSGKRAVTITITEV